jgi:hypothetical protein
MSSKWRGCCLSVRKQDAFSLAYWHRKTLIEASNKADSANAGYVFAVVITYLLAPWSRIPLEKLTGFQLVKKFPIFYRTPRFITAFTRARHLSLSWGSSIQSIASHPTSWRSILLLSSHLRLGLPSVLYFLIYRIRITFLCRIPHVLVYDSKTWHTYWRQTLQISLIPSTHTTCSGRADNFRHEIHNI